MSPLVGRIAHMYSQIDVQMSPLIDSPTSIVVIVICNVKTILLLFLSFDLFVTYVVKKFPLSHRVKKNIYDVLPLDTKLICKLKHSRLIFSCSC